MPHISLCEVTDSCAPSTSSLVAVEPSHIHIPRPSRVRQAVVADVEETPSVPVQLDLAFDQAA
jgi:hypothetical protein